MKSEIDVTWHIPERREADSLRPELEKLEARINALAFRVAVLEREKKEAERKINKPWIATWTPAWKR